MHSKKDISSGTKRILLTISTELLKQVDDVAARDYASRSGVIRLALLEYLRKPENIDKRAAVGAGRDVALERFLEDFKKENPELKI